MGTKKQAQDAIEEACARSGQYYVTHRWMGGMLTNFPVIQRRLRRLLELRAMQEKGDFERMSTKEANVHRDDLDRLEANFSGMVNMKRVPGALFVIDCKKERLAVSEANKLGIPIVAIVDTNCDPNEIQHVIPGNDDAIRACKLIVNTSPTPSSRASSCSASASCASRRSWPRASARGAARPPSAPPPLRPQPRPTRTAPPAVALEEFAGSQRRRDTGGP